MLRFFIAIPLLKEVRWGLSAVVEDLKSGFLAREVRWVPEEQWHFTLVFLGDQPEGEVEKMGSSIASWSNVLTRVPRVVFDRVCFGPLDREPTMIWAMATEEVARELGALRESLSDALFKAGIRWQRDYRSFQAHVTLARFNRDFSARQRELFSEVVAFEYFPSTIELVQSTLTPLGPVHKTVFSFPFRLFSA